MDVLTRSYDAARTGMNTQETNLTPQKVANNLLIRQVSLHINDDPRIEAQPLYVSGVDIGGKRHDVVYVSTMANNIWRSTPPTGNRSGSSLSISDGRYARTAPRSTFSASTSYGASSARPRSILPRARFTWCAGPAWAGPSPARSTSSTRSISVTGGTFIRR